MDKLLKFVGPESKVYISDGVMMYEVGETTESKVPKGEAGDRTRAIYLICWWGRL